MLEWLRQLFTGRYVVNIEVDTPEGRIVIISPPMSINAAYKYAYGLQSGKIVTAVYVEHYRPSVKNFTQRLT